jgi:hypothetical protein
MILHLQSILTNDVSHKILIASDKLHLSSIQRSSRALPRGFAPETPAFVSRRKCSTEEPLSKPRSFYSQRRWDGRWVQGSAPAPGAVACAPSATPGCRRTHNTKRASAVRFRRRGADGCRRGARAPQIPSPALLPHSAIQGKPQTGRSFQLGSAFPKFKFAFQEFDLGCAEWLVNRTIARSTKSSASCF